MPETTRVADQAVIESFKNRGEVIVGGVRFTRANYLDDAYELGRNRENQDARFYRDALREIAGLFGWSFAYRQNPGDVAKFVEHMRSQAALRTPDGRSTIDALRADRDAVEGKLKQQVDLAYRIRNLLWQGRPGQPGITTPKDLDAIFDAVRVLLESAQEYDKRFAEVREGANATYRKAESLNQERASFERKIRDLELRVDRLKAALKGERRRGYKAALRDVSKAAEKIQEDWS